MKVIFVIQGEGRGHLTQALTLKDMLQHAGHEVVEVMVGRSKGRRLPAFFTEKIGMPVVQFASPNFLPSKDNRRFGLLRSAAYNTLLAPAYVSSIWKIRRHIKTSGADAVINFYEVLCGIACSLGALGVPEICVGHQYLFLHKDFRMPGLDPIGERMLRLFTRVTSMGATARLALSIRDYGNDASQRIIAVPPLLRDQVRRVVRHHGDYVLGYILNAGFYKEVLAWHEAHPTTRLHFFWDKADAPCEWQVDDTLTFHRIDDEKFLSMMAGCRAYATTAGFESVCEALYMGKPCMMIPAHVEQMCNAVDAEREMAGVKADVFDMSRLKAFARDYEEDVEFRMWENHAETRIMAAIEHVCNEYYALKDNAFGGSVTPSLRVVG